MYPALKPLANKKPFTPRINTPAPVRPNVCKNTTAESLQVFCRLRSTDEPVSVKVMSDTTLRLTVPPESCVSTRTATWNEYQYSFKKVFTESDDQKEVFNSVALPLVENVIKGKDGLLFTYGVTGSGKTYTMTGSSDTVGIMPRCLDVIFNSISEYQAKRFVFKPDKMNGFEVQSEEEALKELNNFTKYGQLKKNESKENLTEFNSKVDFKIPVLDEDHAFAVFVTYTEVYNNNVYDLLENLHETGVYTKFQKKVVREDAVNVYVHGVTEIEVKTREEAYEVFRKGQKRKRMAHTSLNTESSRSHSIFTIRLVQAPWDITGANVLQDKKSLIISQLSLVDLAGIERTSRTHNSEERLHEAGKINNSLMTLRTCLKLLRENQTTGGSKRIPYRDSRLTRLFKNFFDGKGDIHMVVCVNPRVDDKDENMEVMKFAEVSQQIQVKPTPARPEAAQIGLTPGRRRLNQAAKRLHMDLEEVRENEPTTNEVPYFIPSNAEMIYILESFSLWENYDPTDADANMKLMKFLEDRIAKKKTLMADLDVRVGNFRAALSNWEENYRKLHHESESVNARRKLEQNKMKTLEDQLTLSESNLRCAERERDRERDEIKRLKRCIETKENIIQQFNLEKDRGKRVNQKMAAKVDKLAKEKENTRKERQQIESRLKNQDLKLMLVKQALSTVDDNASRVKTKTARFEDCDTLSSMSADTVMPSSSSDHQRTPLPAKSVTIAVADERYPRTGHGEQWLDHRTATVPINSVMQPVIKRRKSFSNVTSPEDITKKSKYCLMTQTVCDNGTIQTEIHKADIVPTCGGGAQVIFNDKETLTQTSPIMSPVTSPRKTRNNSRFN